MTEPAPTLGSRRLVGLLASAVLLVSACVPSSSNVPQATGRTPVAGGTVTFRVTGDPRSFDAHRQSDVVSAFFQMNAYSTLLWLDAKGKLQDYMAKSWTVTPNSVTFTLKSGMTCSDGTPVTPTVVKNSFERSFKASPSAPAQAYGSAPYTLTADDAANTFTFAVAQPNNQLVYAFTQTFPITSAIICPAGLAQPDNVLATQMFGAGPYTLVEFVQGDHATFKLRPEFNWGPQGTTAKTVGIPETVVIKIIVNHTTAANALVTGSVDVLATLAGAVTGPDIDRLIADSTVMLNEELTWVPRILALNHQTARIGADRTVRQALITAVDPQTWLKLVDNGRGRTSSSFMTDDTTCFDPTTATLAPKPSVESARKVLTDAGWTYASGKLTKDGKPLRFTFTASSVWGAGPEYLVNAWNQMGAEATLLTMDSTGWGQAITTGNYDVSIVQTASIGPNMRKVSKLFTGPDNKNGGQNLLYTVDPILDQEALAAERAATSAEMCQHYANVQQRLWKEWHQIGLSAPTHQNFSKDIDLSLGGYPMMVRRVARR